MASASAMLPSILARLLIEQQHRHGFGMDWRDDPVGLGRQEE
jgi:hypothetical protein